SLRKCGYEHSVVNCHIGAIRAISSLLAGPMHRSQIMNSIALDVARRGRRAFGRIDLNHCRKLRKLHFLVRPKNTSEKSTASSGAASNRCLIATHNNRSYENVLRLTVPEPNANK